MFSKVTQSLFLVSAAIFSDIHDAGLEANSTPKPVYVDFFFSNYQATVHTSYAFILPQFLPMLRYLPPA